MNRDSNLHRSCSRRGYDLFSGARGWEARAHKTLGIDLLGIEHWEPAVKTSEAAGLRTLHADVSALDPLDFADEIGGIGGPGIGVGSPPCQGRSNAGKQLGALDVGHTTQCMIDLADGRDTRAEHAAQCADPRSILTVEPLRWAIALRPRVVLLEQVPPVLPDWKLVGSLLERFGYSWWAGILEAERYGVPQTRERAVLIARRDGVAAHPPVPTHHRFVPNEPRPGEITGLFGTLLPWVSMAETLGWDDGLGYELARGEGMVERHGGRRAVPKIEPAPTISTKARTASWVRAGDNSAKHGRRPEDAEPYERSTDAPSPTVTGTTDRWKLRADGQENATVRSVDEPAPAIKAGNDTGGRQWVHERPAPTIVGTRRSKDGMLVGRQLPEGEGVNVGGWGWNPRQNGGTVRDGSQPAPTMLGEGLAKGVPVWDDEKNCPKAGPNAVRVTVEQAATLQSFPAGWPWQGSRTAQFTQVGNAVPPLLGEAILGSVVDEIELEEAA